MRSHVTLLILLVLFTLRPAPGQVPPARVGSPDGQIELTFSVSAAQGQPAGTGALNYEVSYRGKPVILPSRLGLDLEDQPELGDSLRIVSVKPGTFDETYRVPHGKANPVRNHYNSVTVDLEEERGPRAQSRRLTVEARAFDDGVAFRYVVPEQPAIRDIAIRRELTQFQFSSEGTSYPEIVESFTYRGDYEYNWVELPLGAIKRDDLIALPFLAEVPGVAWVAITEAWLENYAGMYLGRPEIYRTRQEFNGNQLEVRLPARVDRPEIAVSGQTPFPSPWRVVMIADIPGKLVESNLVLNLNPPSAIKDESWIQPGKTSWGWWSGTVAKNVDFTPGMNTATMKHYIDFSADAKLEFMLIDGGWSDRRDITEPSPAIDMPEIIRYAKSKNVGVWVWAHWTAVDRQMDEAFPLFEKWGVVGVKIDFMNRDDQWMVDFYHRVARKAAEHRLMIDFHGAYKPTGLQRTYPNVMSYEAVLGLEFDRWSARAMPDHDVMCAWVRMLAGPMDYTPGGFNNVTAAEFEPRSKEPMALGTRVHQTALFAVFESALQMVADYPEAYLGTKELDFIRAVPAAWDETRVLDGRPNQFISLARRRGREWFVGTITGWQEREVEIPLEFLGEGQFTAEVYADAPDAGVHPKNSTKQVIAVNRNTRVHAKLASGGGHAMHIYPAR